MQLQLMESEINGKWNQWKMESMKNGINGKWNYYKVELIESGIITKCNHSFHKRIVKCFHFISGPFKYIYIYFIY